MHAWVCPGLCQRSDTEVSGNHVGPASLTYGPDSVCIPGYKAAATPAVLESLSVSADGAVTKARMVALLALGCRCADLIQRGGGSAVDRDTAEGEQLS